MIGDNEVFSVHLMKSRSNTKNIDALTYMAASNYIKELNKMDNKEKILKSIESAKKNIEELQKNIKILEERLNKINKWPNEDDLYYYISGCGSINRAFFGNSEYHIAKVEIGNCFKTKQEAEFELEKMKVRAELKKFGFKPNWEDSETSKYYIFYDNRSKQLCVERIQFMQDDIIYFDSLDTVEKAIEQVGEDRIKKYLFGKE